MENVTNLEAHKKTRSSFGTPTNIAHIMEHGPQPPGELIDKLLLEGKVHHLYAEAGSGKSWVALAVSRKLIERGAKVLYLDKENGPRTITERLIRMGANKDAVDSFFTYYYGASTSLDNEAKKEYQGILEAERPSLVVFDSWIGCLSDAAINENQSGEIQGWANAYLHPARERGITVLVLDHVPLEGNGRSRGSGRKKEEVDVQWELHRSKPFDRDTVGKIRLKNKKDREGWLPADRDFRIGGHEGTFIFEDVEAADARSDLTPKQREVLTVLESEFDKGVRDKEWKNACIKCAGIGSSTYYHARDRLLEQGYVERKDSKFFPVSNR